MPGSLQRPERAPVFLQDLHLRSDFRPSRRVGHGHTEEEKNKDRRT